MKAKVDRAYVDNLIKTRQHSKLRTLIAQNLIMDEVIKDADFWLNYGNYLRTLLDRPGISNELRNARTHFQECYDSKAPAIAKWFLDDAECMMQNHEHEIAKDLLGKVKELEKCNVLIDSNSLSKKKFIESCFCYNSGKPKEALGLLNEAERQSMISPATNTESLRAKIKLHRLKSLVAIGTAKKERYEIAFEIIGGFRSCPNSRPYGKMDFEYVVGSPMPGHRIRGFLIHHLGKNANGIDDLLF